MLRPARLARRNLLFNRACTSTVTLEAYQGQTSGGIRHYAAPVTYACVIFEDMRLIVDATGQQIEAAIHILFAMPAPHVTLNDRVTLPDQRQPVIRAIEQDGAIGGVMFPTIIHG